MVQHGEKFGSLIKACKVLDQSKFYTLNSRNAFSSAHDTCEVDIGIEYRHVLCQSPGF